MIMYSLWKGGTISFISTLEFAHVQLVYVYIYFILTSLQHNKIEKVLYFILYYIILYYMILYYNINAGLKYLKENCQFIPIQQ